MGMPPGGMPGGMPIMEGGIICIAGNECMHATCASGGGARSQCSEKRWLTCPGKEPGGGPPIMPGGGPPPGPGPGPPMCIMPGGGPGKEDAGPPPGGPEKAGGGPPMPCVRESSGGEVLRSCLHGSGRRLLLKLTWPGGSHPGGGNCCDVMRGVRSVLYKRSSNRHGSDLTIGGRIICGAPGGACG